MGATRSGAREELLKARLVEIKDFGSFRAKLKAPRAVFLYVPAGRAVDQIVDYWGDSLRRHARLREYELLRWPSRPQRLSP